VHRLARLQRRRFAGSPVPVSSPQGRFATDAELVDDRVLESTDAPIACETHLARNLFWCPRCQAA
jgi:hypothetical protein